MKTSTKNQSLASDDARFDKVYTDPRFIAAPNKIKKVEIDARFKNALNDKQFSTVTKIDKYGRRIAQKDTHALENY